MASYTVVSVRANNQHDVVTGIEQIKQVTDHIERRIEYGRHRYIRYVVICTGDDTLLGITLTCYDATGAMQGSPMAMGMPESRAAGSLNGPA